MTASRLNQSQIQCLTSANIFVDNRNSIVIDVIRNSVLHVIRPRRNLKERLRTIDKAVAMAFISN